MMLSDNDIRKFGFESGLLRLKGTTITRWKDGVDIDFPVLEVDKFARAVEQAAYERAAKTCEERAGPIETYNRSYPHYLECAAAIRALAAKENNDVDR